MSPNYEGPEGPFLLHFSVYYRKYFFLFLIIFFTFILDILHFIVYNVSKRKEVIKMLDKNGMEIKTGMVVEIKDAFFKNDNGLYFVEHSAGDPDWCGSDHSLRKISKRGKISQAKHNLCFWPIGIFISDRFKAAEARTWNKEHATIEIRTEIDRSEVAAHFDQMAEDLTDQIQREAWDYGEDSQAVKTSTAIQKHYRQVASEILA